MSYEIELKILEVDPAEIARKMTGLGAKKVQKVRLNVDWYREHDKETKWFLRLRTYSDGRSEITWKGKASTIGKTRQQEEINLNISEPEKADAFFQALGLEKYAHQDKDRISWVYQDWRFDLDQYPGIPPYLEIEGKSAEHVQEALTLLGLEKYETSAEGERILIEKKYGKNWYAMRFT